MVNFVRRLKAKMKRTMMLILKRLPFHFPEHRINDLPEPSSISEGKLPAAEGSKSAGSLEEKDIGRKHNNRRALWI
ncbi:PREDICTED: PRUPE_1G084100 [Prunus dulcis]|uniref:PREDICTED: PRUPE_1G084100 n=1 Tax=Prunus dulcis TaxID=3755 RepID=A0A5E4FMY5_PRUDU|nr:PREDICTED: PRUPE_1G084100 [Prunus dulcis]